MKVVRMKVAGHKNRNDELKDAETSSILSTDENIAYSSFNHPVADVTDIKYYF